jgi:dienelactone hydrolase
MKTLSPFKSDTQATDEEKGAAYGEVGPWLGRHTDEIALPLVNSVVDALSSDKSVKKLAVVGFCW